jgi:hypothetical protein
VEECVVANGNASEWGRAIGKWPLGKVDRFRVEKLHAFCEKHITATTLANSLNNRIAQDQNDIKIRQITGKTFDVWIIDKPFARSLTMS